MSSTSPRFGVQPIAHILMVRNIGRRRFAEQLGLGYPHVKHAVAGATAPSPQLRQRASEVLDVPVEQLFTADALDAIYCGHFVPASRRSVS